MLGARSWFRRLWRASKSNCLLPEVDDPLDRGFNRSDADGHMVAACCRVVYPPFCMIVCTANARQDFLFDNNWPDLAIQQSSFRNRPPVFAFCSLRLFAFGEPGKVLLRVPDVEQFPNLPGFSLPLRRRRREVGPFEMLRGRNAKYKPRSFVCNAFDGWESLVSYLILMMEDAPQREYALRHLHIKEVCRASVLTRQSETLDDGIQTILGVGRLIGLLLMSAAIVGMAMMTIQMSPQ